MQVEQLVEKIENPSNNHFLTPGTKAQIIGAQNGDFEAFGHHIENEMGGVWTHPIKLLDGFWMGLTLNENKHHWLKGAKTFTNYAFYNTIAYELEGLEIERKHFAPEDTSGLIVSYTFNNKTDKAISFKYHLIARTDLRAVWYADEYGITEGEDNAVISGNTVIVKDSKNEWFTGIQVSDKQAKIECNKNIEGYDKTYGNGIGVKFEGEIVVPSQGTYTLDFNIAGSIVSEDEIIRTISVLQNKDELFLEKRNNYQGILDKSYINIPDKELEKQYYWSKCHIEWLTTVVEGIGAGLTAGNPEYPWWFGCDSCYAIAGAIPAGFIKLSQDTLDTVAKLSLEKNKNGRIIHEANSYGHVGNPGNTQETAQFIYCLYEVYKWSGDKEWLKKHYNLAKMGMEWLLEDQDIDKDLFPEGYGIMEVKGLNGELIDTAVFTYLALEALSHMADLFGEDHTKYEQTAQILKEKIKTQMWLEEHGLFADLRMSPKELYIKISDFINQVADDEKNKHIIPYYNEVRAYIKEKGLLEDDKDAPWLFKNWVINTPLEALIADERQANLALEKVNSEAYVGDWGMYVSGLEQTRIMTISSGSLIHANLKYNKPDEAYNIIKKVMRTFSMYLPGSISEMSPDYGCFVQAWSAYAMISPVITGFMGITVDAGKKEITIAPQLPSGWDYAELKNMAVGDNEIDVKIKRDGDGYKIETNAKFSGWNIKCIG